MFCRRALQRIGPLARRALKPTSTNPPVRHMAFGVPGGSNNMMYFVLCGGGFTAALVYAYKTVSDDSVRYEDRVTNVGSSEKAPAEAAPAEAAPAEAAPAEAAPAEAAVADERAPLEEEVTESVTAPAEPVAETAAEPVVEVETKVTATEIPEPAPTEATAEALATEEPSALVTAEAVPEATSPGMMEVVTLEKTAPEAAIPAESAGMAAVDEAPRPLPTEAETCPDILEAESTSATEVAQ